MFDYQLNRSPPWHFGCVLLAWPSPEVSTAVSCAEPDARPPATDFHARRGLRLASCQATRGRLRRPRGNLTRRCSALAPLGRAHVAGPRGPGRGTRGHPARRAAARRSNGAHERRTAQYVCAPPVLAYFALAFARRKVARAPHVARSTLRCCVPALRGSSGSLPHPLRSPPSPHPPRLGPRKPRSLIMFGRAALGAGLAAGCGPPRRVSARAPTGAARPCDVCSPERSEGGAPSC